MNRLPDKPSELLLLALTDLEMCENDPRYEIYMGNWHAPNGRCRVCAAGAVMAKSLGAPPRDIWGPEDFDEDTERKLRAIDFFRTGAVWDALNWMGITPPKALPDMSNNECGWASWASYDDRTNWKIYMQSLIGILQAEGL